MTNVYIGTGGASVGFTVEKNTVNPVKSWQSISTNIDIDSMATFSQISPCWTSIPVQMWPWPNKQIQNNINIPYYYNLSVVCENIPLIHISPITSKPVPQKVLGGCLRM